MKTRAQVAAAILKNFNTALEATETAYNSTGSAARENAKVLESLNGHIQNLRSEWESLVNSKSTQDFLKFFVDLTTNIIKLVKAIGGLRTVLALLVTTFVTTKVSALGLAFATDICGDAFASTLTKGELFALGLKRIQFAIQGVDLKLKMMGLSLGTVLVAIGAVTIAVTALVTWLDYLSKEWERNDEAFRNAKEAYEDGVSELKKMEAELQDVQDKILEINKHPLDPTQEKTLKDLKEQESQLKTNISLQKAYNNLALETERIKAEEKLKGGGKYSQRELEEMGVNTGSPWTGSASDWASMFALYKFSGLLIGGGMEIASRTTRYGSSANQINLIINAYDEYKQKISELTKANEELTKQEQQGLITEEERNNKQKENSDLIKSYESKVAKLGEVLKEFRDELSSEINVLQEGTEEYNLATLLIEKLDGVVLKFTDDVGVLEDAQSSLAVSTTEYNKALEDAIAEIGTANDTYTDLITAVEEYNKNGKLSITTLAKLIDKYPNYLEMLEKEGFSEEVVTKAIKENIQQKINSMQAEADAILQKKLGAEANIEEAKATLKNAEAQMALTKAYFELPDGVQGAPAPNRYAETFKTYFALQEEIDKLQESLDSTTTFEKTTRETKQTTDAWKDAFTSLYNDLKHRRALDLIDTEQYIDELTKLNDKYFKNRIEYEDEYKKYLEEIYKEQQNLFKERINDLVFAVNMLSNQGANKQTLISKYKEIQEELHRQAEYYRSLGLKENNDLITSLQEQWWKYQKNIESLQEDIAKQIEDTNKEIAEQLKEETKLLDERFEALRDYAVDTIEAQIKEKEDWLEKQNDLIDDQIDKYKDENDELENQKDIEAKLLKIEEARKKLAEASQRKVRVYRDGKGFVYETDQSLVASAQAELDDLLNDWKLFQEKAKISDIIAELEKEKEANKKRVEQEIDDLNKLKDAWDKSLDLEPEIEDYKGWLTTIANSEDASFRQRLATLKNFVASYNAEMDALKVKYATEGEVKTKLEEDSNASIYGAKNYGGVSYFSDIDYQQLINDAVKSGADANELRRLETKRNAKIAGDNLGEKQTSLYGGTVFGKSGGSSSSSTNFTIKSKSSSSSSSSSANFTIGSKSSSSSGSSSSGGTILSSFVNSVAGIVKNMTGLADGTNNADGLMHLVGENRT